MQKTIKNLSKFVFKQKNENFSNQIKQVSNKFKCSLIGENNKLQFSGCKYGRWMTLMGQLVIVWTAFALLNDMYNYRRDKFQSITLMNDFKIYNNIRLQESNFMPYIEIRLQEFITNEDFDIFDKNPQNIKDAASVNQEKLSKYIDIKMNIREIHNYQEESNIIRKFRKCKKQDFINRNYKGELREIENYFCPDMDIVSDHYILKNGYSSQSERTSLSIEYEVCNNANCEPDEKIALLLQKLYFTLHTLTENVDFGNTQNYNKSPLDIGSYLREQYQLKWDRFYSTVSMLSANTVKTKDDRITIYDQFQDYQYLSYQKINQYESVRYSETSNVSEDGQTYKMVTRRILGSSFFYLDNNRTIQSRQVQNILEVIAVIGGMRNVMYWIISQFSIPMNYNMLMGKFIIEMFYPKFDEKTEKQNKDRSQSNFTFNFLDICSNIWWVKYFKYCFSHSHNHQKYFQDLKQSVESQMNLINVVTRLQKITIMLSSIMKNEKFIDIKNESEKNYLQLIQDIHISEQKIKDMDQIYEFIDKFGADVNRYKQSFNLLKRGASNSKVDNTTRFQYESSSESNLSNSLTRKNSSKKSQFQQINNKNQLNQINPSQKLVKQKLSFNKRHQSEIVMWYNDKDDPENLQK